jgi:hypothetical protein
VLCFSRNHKRQTHVGFNTIEVAPLPPGSDGGDDPPLAA